MTMPARTVSAILFDLDGTLYDERGGMARALEATLSEAVRERPAIDRDDAMRLYPVIGRAVWEYAELAGPGNPGGPTSIDLRRRVWTELLETVLGGDGDRRLAEHLAEVYTAERRNGHRLFEESVEVLDELSSRGIPIAMITNGPSDLQREKLAHCRILDRFEPLVISAEAGRAKPDPAIFLDAVAACGSSPADALYVGDNPALDIAGAIGAGLQAAWINRYEEVFPGQHPAPTFTIETLRSLPGKVS